MMLGALVAVVIAALALPALADERGYFGKDRQERYENPNDFYKDFYQDFVNFYGLNDQNDLWEGDNHRWTDERNDNWWNWNDWHDNDRNDNDTRNNRNDDDDFVPVVSQDFEQEARSGEVNQLFNVTNSGDNSNQCAGVQVVANTGNSQNQVGVIQYGSEADDFSFEDSGAFITVSPNSLTSCDQQVNQAASAFG